MSNQQIPPTPESPQTTSDKGLDGAACSLIEAGAKNFMCAGTTMGPHAHQLMYQNLSRDFGKDVCDPTWFNPGYPFRIWRDSGIGYALGRNRPEHSLDGQARTPEEAVAMAGADGIIVTANADAMASADNKTPTKESTL